MHPTSTYIAKLGGWMAEGTGSQSYQEIRQLKDSQNGVYFLLHLGRALRFRSTYTNYINIENRA